MLRDGESSEYRKRFSCSENANYYDNIYARESYDSFIWPLQLPYVIRVMENVRREVGGEINYLDFACGTGRIISAVEDKADHAMGLDVSAEMIAIARKKTKRAKFIMGNLVDRPNLLDKQFEVITAFRFFLNVEKPIRYVVLQRLAALLQGKEGRLIFNIHGNSRSIRHWSVLGRKLFGTIENELSFRETVHLIDSAGLVLESWHGFGLLPRKLHYSPIKGLAQSVDRWIVRNQHISSLCQDLLFVCRKKLPRE